MQTSDLLVEQSTIIRSSGSGIYNDGGTVTVRNSALIDSSTGAQATGGQLLIENSLISGNSTGVAVSGSPVVTITNSSLADNSSYGVNNSSTTVIVQAANNWWGAASGPYHPTLNDAGQGSRVSDRVVFSPWLGAPPAGVERRYTVGGRVTLDGIGLAGVTVSDGTRSATTDASGFYLLNAVPAGTYTLTPARAGYSFTPATRAISVTDDLSGQNFSATTTSGPTPTPTMTPTSAPPTATPTSTSVPPTPTSTSVPPTATATTTAAPNPSATPTATSTASPVPGSSIVANGSFEEPDVGARWQRFSAGATMGQWLIGAGDVDLVGLYWQAADGKQSLELAGDRTGSVHQDLATQPGTTYLLSFAMSGNPDRAGLKQMEVYWGGTLLDTLTFDTTGKSLAEMGWVMHTYMVTTNAPTTRLQFTSLTSAYGPVIDHVRVEGSTGEVPTSTPTTASPTATSTSVPPTATPTSTTVPPTPTTTSVPPTPTTTPMPTVEPGTWQATGSMQTGRAWHTATRLADGRVLVAGGSSGAWGTGLQSAEIYDPATGTWTPTGNMSQARFAHTATLLPNGKVLVAGGEGAGWLSSAEIYDPATGRWSGTGNLQRGRSMHTATLLPNGKVLVAGGYGGGDLASAELYDPVTAQWSTTGSMKTARMRYPAVLLPNGKVLVASGSQFSGGTYPTTTGAEIYDPATGQWSDTGSLNISRHHHQAVVLPNSNVLVAGGQNLPNANNVLSAELYDPASGQWSMTASMQEPHTNTGPMAVLLSNGQALISGGGDQDLGDAIVLSELYNATTGTWSRTGDLREGRSSHAVVVLNNGLVLASGGFKTYGVGLATAELYAVAPLPAGMTVDAITPREGPAGQATRVTVQGTGFATTPPPSARLVGSGGTFALTDVTSQGATSFAATVPATVPPGRYDLVVDSNGRTATLPNAFTVLAAAPAVTGVLPPSALNDVETEMLVQGRNFAAGVGVRLGTTNLETTRIDGTTLLAVVPAGLTPATYDVVVTNPGGGEAQLANAFTVVDATDATFDDLFSSSDQLWINPVLPRANEPFEVGLVVQRSGGKTTLTDVPVTFRRDSVTGPVLGRATVPFLDPPASSESTTPLSIALPNAGIVTLYAIIDPEGTLTESTTTNNVISRTMLVAVAARDQTPPVVTGITINGGAATTVVTRGITVDISALDPSPNASGVRSVHVIEYVYNEGAQRWVPMASSGWLPYNQTPESYRWTLVPLPGMHYLQVRARDGANNISIGQARRLITYEPATDQIRRRQTRIYRYEVGAGQEFRVNLDVLSGDADLYVWSSDPQQSAWVSNLPGSADEQVIIPASQVVPGIYQVEVYGYTAAEYRLSTSLGGAPASVQALGGGLAQEKDLPVAPLVPVNALPDALVGDVPPLEAELYRVYLPLSLR
ncbi:choice-of-anchor C family protein [Candidatus Chloroploca sp. M-50]|uniref:Choice-of-anchor C family protein n=1 Tax=Candidatus Chloroploca mongolica TaxID=2528176 RepID=A0ABS4D4W7_9CHLR|nr:choice-of-anchor C family protein [Candidatus Chloroploca mongolica]